MIRKYRVAPKVVAFLLLSFSPAFPQETNGITIRLQLPAEMSGQQKNAGICLTDLTARELDAVRAIGLGTEQGQRLLQVFANSGTTPLLGKTFLHQDQVVFEPRFPLDDSIDHQVVFDIAKIRSDKQKPNVVILNRVSVDEMIVVDSPKVFPSQDRLPQNVLKMYIQFADEWSQGTAYEHIQFLDRSGQAIPDPFLPIPQELWSRDGTRLTLLFDPGRIKRGLQRNQTFGAPFEVGETYTLKISRKWKSPDNQCFSEDHSHSFTIVEPNRTQPSVDRWQIKTPPSETTDPIVVTFDEAMDYALLQHSLTLIDLNTNCKVQGKTTVSRDGLSWRFTPLSNWHSGSYRLAVDPTLEDLAGNRLDGLFERKNDTNTKHHAVARVHDLKFRIAPSN